MDYRRDEMSRIVSLASMAGGWVYGGFARSVAGPLHRGVTPINDTLINNILDIDIDLYFEKKDNADMFVKCCTANMFHVALHREDNSKHHVAGSDDSMTYDVSKSSYRFTKTWGTYVNVVVCQVLPVDDFDVNTVAFQCVDGKWLRKVMLEGTVLRNTPYEIEECIKNFDNKQATMFPEYIQDDKHSVVVDEKYQSIHRHFFNRGWRVFILDYTGCTGHGIKKEMTAIMTAGQFREFFPPYTKRVETPKCTLKSDLDDLEKHLLRLKKRIETDHGSMANIDVMSAQIKTLQEEKNKLIEQNNTLTNALSHRSFPSINEAKSVVDHWVKEIAATQRPLTHVQIAFMYLHSIL